MPAYKLASMHCVEPWFAALTAKTGKPVILSTGMATLGEVDETVRAIRGAGNNSLVLMQCTTNYPSRKEDTHLRAMQTMAQSFDLNVGYSDHTTGDLAGVVSVGMGATVIEKHFTTDKNLPGPDQSTSADTEEFTALVRHVRQAEQVMGSTIKQPSEIERANAVGMKRSIWTRCDIRKGQVITEDMLIFKRPATGISPRLMNELLGRTCVCDVKGDSELHWGQLGDK